MKTENKKLDLNPSKKRVDHFQRFDLVVNCNSCNLKLSIKILRMHFYDDGSSDEGKLIFNFFFKQLSSSFFFHTSGQSCRLEITCRLGCVCASLFGKRIPRNHCGHEE